MPSNAQGTQRKPRRETALCRYRNRIRRVDQCFHCNIGCILTRGHMEDGIVDHIPHAHPNITSRCPGPYNCFDRFFNSVQAFKHHLTAHGCGLYESRSSLISRWLSCGIALFPGGVTELHSDYDCKRTVQCPLESCAVYVPSAARTPKARVTANQHTRRLTRVPPSGITPTSPIYVAVQSCNPIKQYLFEQAIVEKTALSIISTCS